MDRTISLLRMSLLASIFATSLTACPPQQSTGADTTQQQVHAANAGLQRMQEIEAELKSLGVRVRLPDPTFSALSFKQQAELEAMKAKLDEYVTQGTLALDVARRDDVAFSDRKGLEERVKNAKSILAHIDTRLANKDPLPKVSPPTSTAPIASTTSNAATRNHGGVKTTPQIATSVSVKYVRRNGPEVRYQNNQDFDFNGVPAHPSMLERRYAVYFTKLTNNTSVAFGLTNVWARLADSSVPAVELNFTYSGLKIPTGKVIRCDTTRSLPCFIDAEKMSSLMDIEAKNTVCKIKFVADEPLDFASVAGDGFNPDLQFPSSLPTSMGTSALDGVGLAMAISCFNGREIKVEGVFKHNSRSSPRL